MTTEEEKRRKKRDYARKWRKENPEKARKYVSNWKKNNPEKSKALKRRWRKRKIERKEPQGMDVKCPYCGKWIGGLSKHHAERNLEQCHIPNCPKKNHTQKKREKSAVGSNTKKLKGGKNKYKK